MATELKIYSESVDKGLEGVVACTTNISCVVDATLTYRGYTFRILPRIRPLKR